MNIDDYIKKWKTDYYIRKDVGESLEDARNKNLLLYKNICSVHGKMLFYTNDQFCPCCAKMARDLRKKKNRNFERSRGLFNEIKKRASKKDIKFEITKEDLRSIYGTVKKCPILEIDIDYSENYIGGPNDNSPSIDRLIPELGYIKENISILSQRANRIKNNGSAEEHILIALWMLKNLGYNEKDIMNFINKLIKGIKK